METLKFWHFFEWFRLFFNYRENLKVMMLLRRVDSFNLGWNKVSAVRNVTGSLLSNETRVKIWSCFTSLVSIKDKCLSHFLMLKVEGGSIYPRLCQVQTNILFYALERHVHPTLILPLLVQKERFCKTSQYHLVEGKLVYLHHSWDTMSDEL